MYVCIYMYVYVGLVPVAQSVEQWGSWHKGPGFNSRQNLVNFSLCLDRLCHSSIAHLEAGCAARDRREKSS